MADVIRTDQLAAEVNAILEEYQGTVQEVLEEAVDATAKEVVSELKASSPKRTGAYAFNTVGNRDTLYAVTAVKCIIFNFCQVAWNN